MKHLRPYNELFGIFKKKDIDINALPDKEVLTDILESELPDDIEPEISLVYFLYNRKGDPKRFPGGEIVLTTVEFANRNYHLTPKKGFSKIRKGYKIDFYSPFEGNEPSPPRLLTNVSIDDINIDKFKAYGIKCVQDRKSSILCYT